MRCRARCLVPNQVGQQGASSAPKQDLPFKWGPSPQNTLPAASQSRWSGAVRGLGALVSRTTSRWAAAGLRPVSDVDGGGVFPVLAVLCSKRTTFARPGGRRHPFLMTRPPRESQAPLDASFSLFAKRQHAEGGSQLSRGKPGQAGRSRAGPGLPGKATRYPASRQRVE